MNKSTLPQFASGLVWFRRDLRAHDQAALYHALRQCKQVHADRKSTRLNSSHVKRSRMPSSA